MRYFTREQHDAYNSTDPEIATAATADFNRSCELYRGQLKELQDRFADRGSIPIDDWMVDEVTGVDENVLRHEVLFSSGATLLLEFETMSVRSTAVERSAGLPYLDPEEQAHEGEGGPCGIDCHT